MEEAPSWASPGLERAHDRARIATPAAENPFMNRSSAKRGWKDWVGGLRSSAARGGAPGRRDAGRSVRRRAARAGGSSRASQPGSDLIVSQEQLGRLDPHIISIARPLARPESVPVQIVGQIVEDDGLRQTELAQALD